MELANDEVRMTLKPFLRPVPQNLDAFFGQVDDLIKTKTRLRLGCEYIKTTLVTVMPMDEGNQGGLFIKNYSTSL